MVVPKVKQVLNVAMHVMKIFFWGDAINTTAYHLGQ